MKEKRKKEKRKKDIQKEENKKLLVINICVVG